MRTFRGMNLDPKFCTHGYATYTDEAGRVHVATGVRCSDVVPPAVAERARVAVRTLDRLVETQTVGIRASYELGWRDGYAASEEQHNRHYVGVPSGPGEVRMVRICDAHGEHPHNGITCLDCPVCRPPQHNAHTGDGR